MASFQRILAAIGVAPSSEGIFACAVNMSRALDAELIVASVINIRDMDIIRRISMMGYDIDGEHYLQGVRQEREDYLAKIMKNVPVGDLRMQTRIEIGNPLDKLLELMEQEKVDMIVMGPKGQTDLEHIMIGSVASKLFRRSPVTVVSYREKHET